VESSEAPLRFPCRCRSLVSEPALRKVDKLAEGGHPGAKTLATYGSARAWGMNQRKSVRAVVPRVQRGFSRASNG